MMLKSVRAVPIRPARLLPVVLLLTWLAAAPAHAGYYKLVRYSGQGSYQRTAYDGTTTTEQLSSYWDEDFMGAPGISPFDTVELNPGEQLDGQFNETYEFQWVEDYPGELPQDDTWEVDWDSTIEWIGNSGQAWEPASMTGSTEASINSSSGTTTHKLSGSMSSTPDGMGGANVTEVGHVGQCIGWLEFPLSGASPSVTVTYKMAMALQLVGGRIGQQKQGPKRSANSINITAPTGTTPLPNMVATVISVDFSSTKRGKAGAQDQPGDPLTRFRCKFTITSPSGVPTSFHTYFDRSSSPPPTQVNWTPIGTGNWKIQCGLEVSDGKKWNRIATSTQVIVPVQ
jgi:hypothetical protein